MFVPVFSSIARELSLLLIYKYFQIGQCKDKVKIGTELDRIQERLDFSCAMFGPDGGLVANAPHIPVHLGSMQETVKYQVFYEGERRPVFYVASRGHHADIGGLAPGSMPPNSKTIFHEGAVFISFKLVTNGRFQEEALTEKLMAPKDLPGCSGTRNLPDNKSDLQAQVAANKKEQTGRTSFSATERLDDGSPIKLTVSIDIETGCLYPVTVKIPDPCLLSPSVNAAVVGGNVLTCQRTVDVILKAFKVCAASQGCMNITAFGDETKYQYVETLAGGAGAGCMNNVLFGDASFGYYETIAGGAGAGPTWEGRSGVHVHMTNTRITDPEVLEHRYPVVLRCFHLNPGSGGRGRHNGGDGIVRELLFRRAVKLSVLSERRAFQPFGLEGK
ncbi:hypothetical protein QZH41_007239 [Actinostola sp. cb2023]|nr:hypothetical protein QZH41_007239 [Actinostola sp. cb2023]